MAIGISSILTRHLWGIGETTLDEAVPCWAFAFVCTFTLWELLQQDHLVRNALDNMYFLYPILHSSDVILHRDQVFKSGIVIPRSLFRAERPPILNFT